MHQLALTRYRVLFLMLVALIGTSAQASIPSGMLSGDDPSLALMLDKTLPAVVNVVGSFALARTADADVFELFKVYLLPRARGGGTARAMLREALAHARARGGRRLRLWTDSRFAEGHRFYERNGFVRLPGSRAVPDASDTWEFAYSRTLDPAAP